MQGYNDNMPYGNSEAVDCKVCGSHFEHCKKLSEHIKKNHAINPIEYYVRFFHDNSRPTCPICGGETRYVSLSEGFKKFCKEHARTAMSQAGTAGGQAPAWNKGKTKETDERILTISKKLTGSGNPFFGKQHTEAAKKKNAASHRKNFEEVVQQIMNQIPSIKIISDWTSYDTQNSQLRLVCNTCKTEDEASFFNLKRCWRCKRCNPIGSRQQHEISNYVRSLGFEVFDSTREIIPPLEIDIWIPEKNLAIEYHGLYWHSGGHEKTFDKNKHRKKYEACRDLGIKLIQIFSDEWIKKNDICRSIIKNALHKSDFKLNARDCTLVDLTTKQAQEFLNSTHISGYTRSRHKIGLLHKEMGLVGVATTRTPIQTKWGHLSELSRMSFSQNTSVRGGASKLLTAVKQCAKNDGFSGVLSYADLRFGDGGVYEKCGFLLAGETPINYWYTDGHSRMDRFAFRAQEEKSETAVALSAGVRQVWGAGNKIFISKF